MRMVLSTRGMTGDNAGIVAGPKLPRASQGVAQTMTAVEPGARQGLPGIAPPDVVVVGGAGHVGLPFSLTLAQSGLRVGIFDTAAQTLETVAEGRMPFLETGAEDLLREVLPTGRLLLSADPSMVHGADVVVMVIGTPIDEFLNPSMVLFDAAVNQILPHLSDGSILILRSTVYPGTTAHVDRLIRESGRRVDVAFCPERIAEGKALEELTQLPQIVGADNETALNRAEALFARLGVETVPTTSKEAELAKLLTNAWRYMKFAVANQFFLIAHTARIDYNNVLRAIRHNYPRAADLPGPGLAAGPCLLKDTMQLAAFTSDHFPMGQSAMQINEGLPSYMVAALEQRFGSLVGRTIGILGMAFKADSDDPRASLSYKLRKLLSWTGANVLCTDPYVTDARLVPLETVLDEAELLIIAAPHRVYREMDLRGRQVVDIWGAVAGAITL
jgi:UDP-N-acetyl-D-mannosaminuronic acid dehydrogenase